MIKNVLIILLLFLTAEVFAQGFGEADTKYIAKYQEIHEKVLLPKMKYMSSSAHLLADSESGTCAKYHMWSEEVSSELNDLNKLEVIELDKFKQLINQYLITVSEAIDLTYLGCRTKDPSHWEQAESLLTKEAKRIMNDATAELHRLKNLK